MGAAPSIPTDPSRTVQVIGAGFSRTGTVSMQMALEILLKGPVLHGGTQIITREDAYCKTWMLAYHARHAGDHAVVLKHVRDGTRGFVGTTDLPTIDFIPELLELYPDARVVLVKRDPVTWWRSTLEIQKAVELWWLKAATYPIPGWRWLPYLIDEFAASAKQLSRRQHILANYYDRVRSATTKGQLLEMELSEGWEPLCRFLDVPVPDQPFPRANDTAAMEKTAGAVVARIAQVWLGILGVLGGTVYLGTRLL
ncbi:P-loop containing nucleoside triphosphate hydrolase protein [Microdochium bolleyi]|uniref:p-loop containing nucleoside triphosphate hydrolase protein n=1 Tax=Microdochium bolleyi TaxID=196109 RepID=A0A136IMX1_9PEZI|nr:P-loop containing nucleoside triphosphate hydrolase protein [Microdochium bolleyi]